MVIESNLQGKKELLKRVGNMAQLASVRHFEFIDGKADSIKAFHVCNGGGLDFTVLESKALDIYDMKFNGINLNFISKPGLVSPGLSDNHGLSFLRSLQGGMMFTCGLNNVGSECVDDGVYNGFHGRIRDIPAEKVSIVEKWEGDSYILSISGEMRESALFHENLVLRRTISTKMGSHSIYIHNEIENEGFEDADIMFLLHINVGYPLLDEGARLVIESQDVIPRDDAAMMGINDWDKITSPIDQFNEQVFSHNVKSDSDGNAMVTLINDALGLGLYVKYNVKQFPNLIEWKSMKTGDYALGIEPSNCSVNGRVSEKANGTIQKLAPIDKVNFDIEIGIVETDN